MRRAGAVLIGLGVGVLHGCGSDDAPGADMASVPSSSTAVPASTAPPTRPTTTSIASPTGAVVEGYIAQPRATIAPAWERQVTGRGDVPQRDELLVVANDDVIVAGTGEGWAVALDPVTGDERWAVDLRGDTQVSEFESYGVFPAITTGGVVVATSPGDVHRLDPATGDSLWAVSLDRPVSGYPVVADDVVVVALSWDAIYDDSVGYGEITPETTLGLFGLDLTTGEVRWQQASTDVAQVAAGPDGHVLVAWSNQQDPGAGSVALIDAATGDAVWSVDGISSRTPPALGDQTIAIATDSGEGLLTFDTAGVERWRTAPMEYGSTQFPIVIDGTVAAADNMMSVHGFDAGTGTLRWRHAIGDNYGMLFRGPDGMLAVSIGGWVSWVDLDSGEVAVGSSVSDQGGVYSVVSTANGEVVGAADGVVRLFRL